MDKAQKSETLHLTYSCGDAEKPKDKLQATSHAESADQTNCTMAYATEYPFPKPLLSIKFDIFDIIFDTSGLSHRR